MCLSHSHSICNKSFNFHDCELKILWVIRNGVLRKQDLKARSHGITEKKLRIKYMKVHAFLKHTVSLSPILFRHNMKHKFPKTEVQ